MSSATPPLDVAVLLFDRFTALDAVGPYEVLSRLPGASVTVVAERAGPVANDSGSLTVLATRSIEEVPRADILLVPGGPGHAALTSGAVVEWVSAVHATTRWTASVCTGSLVLGAAGLLAGLRATSHWLMLDDLEQLGAHAVRERVVVEAEHRVITAAGVSAGIDMGLVLAALVSGETVAQAIQLLLEYAPSPPFDAGSPQRAPAALVDLLTSRARDAARRG